ncbi:DJ-1/PfpI family protein [Haloferax mediterranei ATCC 33500]|uniref:AraC family transcriptional regulator n=1 Tax=Haloferax mediterranei (strain ATCC 33500 / DSM 1411 / JCM 8866 / NBRC 14739 / NCIMB 2177 / R-4) TaxID=523841 RepID=I3R8L8_HALMT|nr:DJ-1/PfpI family protein [Haloferax mediterranei]AFK20578.1 ThiJ/PfpI domain protein [Haloferax mediterranei ATCC 33500]AHZ23934.1 AraC family transcriptional regulator [Haloferax mediterranei ATCC 33500]ELZ98361.1 ThiJ/PfpI domain-containing protein [Haloferax mediterranei ATCC 33500]MDX5986665.1 DJ-1/PfpI family protein [Haloferax mediterranei ATCC 33500]QCQ75997.1 DJ-1/PfpI family protein [Haloferax mediterranei ATCC 33500]
MHVAILLYDGFDELDAVAPFEVFQNAGVFGADCEAELLTLDDRDFVTASHGMRVGVDGVLNPESDRPDLLIVPGGGWNSRAEQSAWAEAEKGAIPEAISTLHEEGTVVAGVCTGGMLLARAGILDSRPAVTHGDAISDLRETAADVVSARIVDDGDVLTAGGVTSGLDLSLHIVEREFGTAVADQIATEIEYERKTNPFGDK